jgi:choice-of-anchor B domain-containing protein
MFRIVRLFTFLIWILCAGQLFAQCQCMGTGCGSGCACGCNAPDTTPGPDSGESNFESNNVELLSNLTLADLGVTATNVRGNDCWGWRHQASGREFAIYGLTDSTKFVEITDPRRPIFLGTLNGAGGNDTWRDMKVYNNRCYIVADGGANASHGVQVFDLNRLLSVRVIPATFSADARYEGLGRAHNIAINEDTGFAYVVGSSSLSSSGGPIMLDLKQGIMPVLAAVFSEDGYCHDCQVVNYRGPIRSLHGKEIAFCSNEDSLTILDVTNKNSIVLLSRTEYESSAYTHQGWLNEEQSYIFVNDELDEQQIATTRTRTHVWKLDSLTAPKYVGFIQGTNRTIDHNLYVKGNYIYEANYSSGLRILDARKASNLKTVEAGFFDTYPANNNVSFNGAWSVYPFFPSGSIIVSDRQNGLFVVKFTPP